MKDQISQAQKVPVVGGQAVQGLEYEILRRVRRAGANEASEGLLIGVGVALGFDQALPACHGRRGVTCPQLETGQAPEVGKLVPFGQLPGVGDGRGQIALALRELRKQRVDLRFLALRRKSL